jgi:hypothetical protein
MGRSRGLAKEQWRALDRLKGDSSAALRLGDRRVERIRIGSLLAVLCRRRYTLAMILPFDRRRMRERNALDEAEESEEAVCRTPSENLATTLALSDLARALARGAGSAWVDDPGASLAEKSGRYAAPLRLLLSR